MPELAERVRRSVLVLMHELLDGPGQEACFVLNRGDRGLLASLDGLSAAAASERHAGRSSVAAHVDHLRYGFELMNRWVRGEDPWSDADFAASWERQQVDDEQWRRLRAALGSEARAWMASTAEPRDWDDIMLTGVLASVVHLAYHVGAIRQIQTAAGGPPAQD